MSECNTVKCHKEATKTIEIITLHERQYIDNFETVIQKEYCDEHADMWLRLDGSNKKSVKAIDGDAPEVED